MKFLTASMLMLAVFPLVVVAKRRRVPFMICPSTKSNSSLVTVKPARSKIECSVICLNDPDCLSASYCESPDGYTCQLSSFYADGTCARIPADSACTQTAMVYPCENGGTFFSENRTCQCVEGFLGDYCQRRYRDCKETPLRGVVYTIQPLGSDYIFEWYCGPPSWPYTTVSEFFFATDYNYTLSWEQMKQGISVNQGYFFTGLENLHQLTKQGVYNLFIFMAVMGKDKGYVIYKNFQVHSETDGYACHWDSFESLQNDAFSGDVYLDGLGALGDSTKSLNGAQYGTFDKDINGCASAHKFAWWFNPLGCTLVTFQPDGPHWPTNRNGTVAIEKLDVAKICLENVHWYVEDDLIL